MGMIKPPVSWRAANNKKRQENRDKQAGINVKVKMDLKTPVSTDLLVALTLLTASGREPSSRSGENPSSRP